MRPLRYAGPISSTLALAVLAGCGGGNADETVFTPVAGTESAYCDTFRAWQVHELDGGEGDDQPNPAALKAYWADYLEFIATMREQAPPEVSDEWLVSERAVQTVVTPVLEKYEFDVQKIGREATAAEQAFAEPTGDAKKAQDAIHAYEARVCGVDQPPAANLVFKADETSEAYCTALGAFDGELEKIVSSRFDPKVMRSVLDSESFEQALDSLDGSAPAAIAVDVEAETEWERSRWGDVIAELGYDIRRIWVDGTPEDRAVFSFRHPDIVEHAARTTAYEEQVCAKAP